MNINCYIGKSYTGGRDDCYGLVRRFLREEYGIQLRNYARPVGFDHSGLNLLTENFQREGFERVNLPKSLLEPGDGLLFSIASPLANHVGVYVGGGRFLHHLYRKASSAEFLDPRWERRLVGVVRNPDITQINRSRTQKVDIMSLLPPHLRTQGGVVL